MVLILGFLTPAANSLAQEPQSRQGTWEIAVAGFGWAQLNWAMHVPGKKTWLWLAALAGGAVAAVLYFFAPDQYAFYPHCAFYAVTGLKCPGCGGLRAAHYILHGEFLAAFRSNPLLVLLLPSLGIGLAGYALRRHAGGAMPSLWDHPGWLWVVLGVVIAFAVIRNLPFAQGF